MRNIKEQFIHHSIGVVSGLGILLASVVLHDTFIDTEPPFYTENDRVIITQNGNGTTLRVFRDLYVTEQFDSETTRHLNPEDHDYPQYFLPISRQVFYPNKTQEAYKSEIYLFVSPALVKGSWCMHATVYWKPTFSLKTHSTDATEVCAEVK